MTSFRFSALKVLLTYSQVCEYMTKESVYYSVNERYDIDQHAMGEEAHHDGGRHIHAVFVFKLKVDSRDPRLFDVNCGNPDCIEDHHPNIRPIKRGAANLQCAIDYATKEDPTPFTNIEPKLTWGEIVEQAQCQEEYLSLVRKHYPRDFALCYKRLKESASALFPTGDPNTILENSYRFPLQELPPAWATITERLPEWNSEERSLVLVGPPGCGKTSWAKTFCPKPALFVRHLDSLRLFDPSFHRSIIFDDLTFGHLPVSTQKYLTDCMDLAEIHIRYGIAKIPAGTPRVFTCNEWPFEIGGVHAEAIRRRVVEFILD